MFRFSFYTDSCTCTERKNIYSSTGDQQSKYGTHRRQSRRIPGHWNRVLPAMILTGTVLGGTAHGIRFQIKNLYNC